MAGVGNVDLDVFTRLGKGLFEVERDEVSVGVEELFEVDSGSFSHCSIGDWNIVICHDLSLSGQSPLAEDYNLIYTYGIQLYFYL